MRPKGDRRLCRTGIGAAPSGEQKQATTDRPGDVAGRAEDQDAHFVDNGRLP